MPPKRAKAQSLQDFFNKSTEPKKASSWADEEDEETTTVQKAPVPKPAEQQAAPAPSAWGKAPTAHPMADKKKVQQPAAAADDFPAIEGAEVKKVPIKTHVSTNFEDENGFGDKPSYRKREFTMKPKFEQKEINEEDIPKESPFMLFIGNLSFEVQRDMIREFFTDLEILNISLPFDKEKQKPKGFAYVEFADEENLRKAIEFKGQELLGRSIRVDLVNKEVAERYCVANRPPQQNRRGGFGGPRPDRKPFNPKPVDDAPIVKTEADEVFTWRRKAAPKPASAADQEATTTTTTTDAAESTEEPVKKSTFGNFKPRGEHRGGFRGGRGGFRGGRGGFQGDSEERPRFNMKPRSVDAPVNDKADDSKGEFASKPWTPKDDGAPKQQRKAFPSAFQTKKKPTESAPFGNNKFSGLNDETE